MWRLLQIKRNVELTTRMVREYITEHVETKLAFDIPASWRLFMVSLPLCYADVSAGHAGKGLFASCCNHVVRVSLLTMAIMHVMLHSSSVALMAHHVH